VPVDFRYYCYYYNFYVIIIISTEVRGAVVRIHEVPVDFRHPLRAIDLDVLTYSLLPLPLHLI
jgi:hypothetical protein